MLQRASLFAIDRSIAPVLEGRKAVLCLGDSNTYGVIVPATQTYPAHLQEFLDARAPDEYSVINLGVPGMNSSQIRRRIDDHLDRYRPDVVVVWVGTNDVWNHMEIGRVEPASRSEKLEGILLHSRVYRLLRNLVQDISLHAALEEIGNRLREAGVPLVLLRDPLDFRSFELANRAITTYASDSGVLLVDASKSLLRVPFDEVEWLYGDHPKPPVYREIARGVAKAVLEQTRP